MRELSLTVYTPDSPLGEPGKLLRGMFRDLLAARGLAWRLFIRDISAQYRQSLLGYVWAFLPPIATSMTFVFLNSQKIMSFGETTVPYPAFVLIGATLWLTFVDALNSPIKLVQASKSMLTKINFPREALLLAGFGEVLFNFAIRSLILVGAFLWFQLPIPNTAYLFPLGILALIAFGSMLGLFLTPLGMLYQDIGRGLTLVTGFWMLLTPVVYPAPRHGAAEVLGRWNPVSPLIICAREWLTSGRSTHEGSFVCIVAATLVLFLIAWLIYRLAMPHLIERMGG